MSFLEHLDELRKRFVRVFAVTAVVTLFMFVFKIDVVKLGDTSFPIPYLDPFSNVASQVIERIKSSVLPPYVKLVVTNPTQAIIAQLYMSIFLGVLLCMPYIVYEIGAFIGPALYPHEKKMMAKLVIPATTLFVAGVLFSYIYITPFSMDFLYQYAVPLGAETFITLDEMIGFVLRFVLGFGLAFQLPIFMWALTKSGIVNAAFWMRNLRYAVVGMVIFGAVITPDGSGLTMWLVAAPMIVLYLGGYLFLRRIAPREKSSN